MNKLLIFVIAAMMTVPVWAQKCDIVAKSLTASPASISLGQSTELRFEVFNDAKAGGCVYAANSVQVILALPNTGVAFTSFVSPAEGKGAFFTWTYDAAENAVIGINHTPLAANQGEMDVVVLLKATPLPVYDVSKSVVLNIQQNPEGEIFPANNENNDNRVSVITLRATAPVELVSYSALSTVCDKVELKWETAPEQSNDFMDLQRSLDGRTFVTIATIRGTNTTERTTYNFTDDKGLRGGHIFHYRLRQVSFDGRETMLPLGSVQNNCPYTAPALELYPNPAFDKVFANVLNVTDKSTVKLIITNVTGEQVMTVPTASVTAPNEIKLQGLPSGIYNVRIDGADDTTTKRFIKVD